MKPKYILLLSAAALVLIGSFFLPTAVAGITDSRKLNNLITIDSQSISFNSAPELDIPERLALLASPATELLALKTGQVMSHVTVGDRVIAELGRFFRGGPFAFYYDKQIVEECAAAFLIDSENPSVNLIVWELTLSDSLGNSTNVIVDDETGTILKLIYRWESGSVLFPGGINNAPNPGLSDEELSAAALSLSEMMSNYYGAAVTLADYQFSGSLAYYRADMPNGAEVISMFGVMRSNSFTMNEKLLY